MAAANIVVQKPHVRLGRAIDHYELKKLPIVLRSKYYMYNQPSIQVSNAQSASRRRIRNVSRRMDFAEDKRYGSENDIRIESKNFNDDESLLNHDRSRHERLIGQLKAAEARNRIRMTRMRYTHHREDDVSTLIQCQPTAIKAVRLEAFITEDVERVSRAEMKRDPLPPIERRRLEALINDDIGLLFERLL